MTRIPREKIDEIRQSVDIVDVISQYISLNKKGSGYMAICPFHDDHDPSLSVSQSKQIYKCFVCGNGGNVFTFLQEYLHISYLEAVKMVAEMGHVDMGGYVFEKKEAPIKQELKPLYEMHTEAEKIYSYYLNTKAGTLAKDYLHQRGFDEQLIKTFEIGYAPERGVLHSAFEKLGYSEIDMVKSGLIIESQGHYDRFKDRIMFPLHDENGRIIGFSGRIYKNGAEGAKYMNSPESDIFIKGQTLYNYHRCREMVKKEGFVYINEGFMDVIAMTRANHGNCIALMGTALTKGHLRMLGRLTHSIVVCLDGDAPGQAASAKTAQFLSENGFDVQIVTLPEGRDPDEIFTSEGQDGLDEALGRRQTYLEFLIKYESSRLDLANYNDRRTLLDRITKEIAKLNDKPGQDHFIKVLSDLSQFPENTIRELMAEHKSEEVPVVDFGDIVTKVKDTRRILDKYNQAERNLLFYMLNDKAVSDKYEQKVGFMYNDTYRVLASYVVDYYRNHAIMDEADLMDRIGHDQERLIHTLATIATLQLPLPYDEKAIDDYIRIISQNALKMKKEQLKEQFHYVLDPKQKAEILKEMINLDK